MITTNQIFYESVQTFQFDYERHLSGDGESQTEFLVRDTFNNAYVPPYKLTPYAGTLREHGDYLTLELTVTGAELQTTPIEYMRALSVSAGAILSVVIVATGPLEVDAAHMTAIIDNNYYFRDACDIEVKDTAANIAEVQQYMAEAPDYGWHPGGLVVHTQVVDSASALKALPLDAIQDLADGGVTAIDVTGDRLNMSLDQYKALGGFDFADEDRHVVRGTAGADRIAVSGDQWTALHGSAGDDRLTLGAGGGEIWGCRGRDVLTGGAGADLFAFVRAADSGPDPDRADLIRNFDADGGDRIRLAFLDGHDGHPAIDWLGTADFSGHAGELRAEAHGHRVVIEADADGDGARDFALVVRGQQAISEADFLV